MLADDRPARAIGYLEHQRASRRLDYCACGSPRANPTSWVCRKSKSPTKNSTQFFTDLGYHVATYGQKAWNGVAVLSRNPAEVLDRGLPGEDAFGSRLLRVKVDDLHFTTVYCPNGKDLGHDDFPNGLAWFDSLLRYWSAQDRKQNARRLRGTAESGDVDGAQTRVVRPALGLNADTQQP